MDYKIPEKVMEEIRKKVEEEFPDDPALQQIHIARKIIVREAELAGMSYLKYIKSYKGQVELEKV